MKLPRIHKGIFPVLAAVVILTVLSAGCIGNISFLPDEVANHGNVITVDSHYVDSATIMELLFNPSEYEKNLFNVLGKYLPEKEPVIEIGAGTGVVMAYVNNRLAVPKNHIAVEPNPNLQSLLQSTIQRNFLNINLQQAAVVYNWHYPEVPITVSKNLLVNSVRSSENEDTIMVPATTVSDLIESSDFADSGSITLIIETDGLAYDIFTNEPSLKNSVQRIIVAFYADSQKDIDNVVWKAEIAGYSVIEATDADNDGVRVYVFERSADFYQKKVQSEIEKIISQELVSSLVNQTVSVENETVSADNVSTFL